MKRRDKIKHEKMLNAWLLITNVTWFDQDDLINIKQN